MFDAKSILEALVNGAAPQRPAPAQAAPGGLGGLGDILGQLGGGAGGGGLADILGKLAGAGGGQGSAGGGQGAGGGLGGLSDILGKLGGAAGGGGHAPERHATAPADQGGGLGGLGDILGKLGGAASGGSHSGGAPATHGGEAGGGGPGSLADILGKLQQQAGAGGGSLMDILGKALAQASEGVKEGAGRIGDATGAREAMGRASQQMGADDILAKLKELAGQNPLGAGAAMGGLGGLVLGTKTGRSLAGSAIKLGALAMIGGLAYKALQNYQAGRPLITGADQIAQAPAGSGFEPQAVTQETAALIIRAMIGAAAADGRIDAAEQAKIMGGLKQATNVDASARAFLEQELQNPATPEQLAEACQTPEQAVQVFTAARFAIELDEQGEADFLNQLAGALGIDGKLAQHIDAQARAATSAA